MDRRQIYRKWEKIKESRVFDEYYFFAVALILAFGTIQTAGTAMNTERPVVTVVSCSMYPKYNVGDVIAVKGQDFDSYEVGDIVVFDAESKSTSIPIIHRVIEKRENSLETQGDNTRGQHDFEKNISPDQMLGKALFSVPRVGALKLLAMDLTGVGGVNTDQPNGFLTLENRYSCTRI